MKCGLSHSGMDAAYDTISMATSGEKWDMHSGSTFALVLAIERNISKRDLGVVFMFQGGRPTIISLVIWFVFEPELRFGDMRGVLECGIQTSARCIWFCLRRFKRRLG